MSNLPSDIIYRYKLYRKYEIYSLVMQKILWQNKIHLHHINIKENNLSIHPC